MPTRRLEALAFGRAVDRRDLGCGEGRVIDRDVVDETREVPAIRRRLTLRRGARSDHHEIFVVVRALEGFLIALFGDLDAVSIF